MIILLDQLGDQSCPAGLMACTDPGAVVAMKIFVKQQVVPPVRISLKQLRRTEHGTPSVVVAKEDADEPPGQLCRHLPERGLPS